MNEKITESRCRITLLNMPTREVYETILTIEGVVTDTDTILSIARRIYNTDRVKAVDVIDVEKVKTEYECKGERKLWKK